MPALSATTLAFDDSCSSLTAQLDTVHGLTDSSSSSHSKLIQRRSLLQTEIETAHHLNKHFLKSRTLAKHLSSSPPNKDLLHLYSQCLLSLTFFKKNPHYQSSPKCLLELKKVHSKIVEKLSTYLHLQIPKDVILTDETSKARKRSSVTSAINSSPKFKLHVEQGIVTLLRGLIKKGEQEVEQENFWITEEGQPGYGFIIDDNVMVETGIWAVNVYAASRRLDLSTSFFIPRQDPEWRESILEFIGVVNLFIVRVGKEKEAFKLVCGNVDGWDSIVSLPISYMQKSLRRLREGRVEGVREKGSRCLSMLRLFSFFKEREEGMRELVGRGVQGSIFKGVGKEVEVVCMEGLKDVAEGIASVEEVGEGDGGICRVTSDTCYAVKCVKAEEKSLEELCEGKNCGWDVGGKAGEDFVRHLVILCINRIVEAGKGYRDGGRKGEARREIFLLNNACYLRKQLGEKAEEGKTIGEGSDEEADEFVLEEDWFTDMLNQMMDKAYQGYVRNSLGVLRSYLTDVDTSKFKYQSGNLLSLDSGRQLKSRFGGFSDALQEMHEYSGGLRIWSDPWREKIQQDGVAVVEEYTVFFDKYSRYQFSKKKQEEYLRYPPMVARSVIEGLFTEEGKGE
ncbi:hypothetical protein TL16_g08800 [Triparma laevis f. inornata]|uniref:Exocyst complex subunit Exo70 C-terminal domain-containing protein n=1 Tax=Triparma laevis f. inornata TaxID=1714386 RepID=A0A9W7EJL8_9STRA|nr:hypothetical protein TL16_g08800 [Triparma laevis f. inornata]